MLISITSLLLGIGILLIGHGLFGTLLTLRAALEGYSNTMIGIIMAAYFGGYILGTFLAPVLINRIGHIRAFAVTGAIACCLVIFHGLVVNPWVWLMARFIYGACIVGIYLIIESWLNARTSDVWRGRIFAVYMLINLIAMAAGQQLLLVGSVGQLELFAIAAALFSLSLVPLALTPVPEPERLKSLSLDLRQLYQTAPLGMMGCLASGLAGGAFWTLGPLFAHQTGLTDDEVAALMSATILGGALFQWPVGHWSDRVDRRKVLAGMSFGATVFALVTALAPQMPLWYMLIIMFSYGGTYFAIYPLSVAHSNDRATPEQLISIGGSLLLSYGIGATLGPLVGGVLMEFVGPYSLPVFYAACWLMLGLFALHRIRHVAPVAREEVERFRPLLRTSPLAIQIITEKSP